MLPTVSSTYKHNSCFLFQICFGAVGDLPQGGNVLRKLYCFHPNKAVIQEAWHVAARRYRLFLGGAINSKTFLEDQPVMRANGLVVPPVSLLHCACRWKHPCCVEFLPQTLTRENCFRWGETTSNRYKYSPKIF